MKKFLAICACMFLMLACISCVTTPSSSPSSESKPTTEESQVSESETFEQPESPESDPNHVHSLNLIIAVEPTCVSSGKIECYFCWGCKSYFADENATEKLTEEQIIVSKIDHVSVEIEGKEPTCDEDGAIGYWECTFCKGKFTDEECTERLSNLNLVIPSLPHDVVYYEGYPVNGEENGMIDHWKCNNCNKYFVDEECETEVAKEDTVLRSYVNMPDFLVEVPEGENPIVLQIADTQIIDGAQTRPGSASEGDRITYETWKIQQYCYDYLTEIITETKPHLIIMTGDLIYGKYDDNGTLLQSFIAFMESFKIPWAPVFGNHESESYKGIDWQCEQLENAEYCLFKQRNLMGNGNYSVGIKQGDKITRMFFMLDSNGNSTASQESLSNGHTTRSVGFFDSQIKWYTSEIERMKELSPETKYSFAFHIQMAVFGEAFEKYGFEQSVKKQNIKIDELENKAEGDFGYIGRQMKDPWDASKTVFEGMKALGVDSIFVGHEHCNSASVVYEGVRFQYGQKSSEYDRHNAIDANGNIVESQIWKPQGTPVIGGSVIVLSATDGEIIDAYIYYCQNNA